MGQTPLVGRRLAVVRFGNHGRKTLHETSRCVVLEDLLTNSTAPPKISLPRMAVDRVAGSAQRARPRAICTADYP
jgi:hypothetical protein